VNSRALFLVTFFISISVLSSWIDKVERQINGVKPGVTIQGEDVGGLLKSEVRSVVEEMAIRYQKLPVEPTIDKETGEVIDEQDGYIVDIEKNIEKIFLAEENECLELEIIKVHSQYSGKTLKDANQVLGYFETWIRGSSERYTNISLAATSINNIVIWPGEVFSFNEIVGPRTPEMGYLPAPVILKEGSDMDFGGGVCQVSSTIYNAAQEASLRIIERHPHSKAIHYVPEGRDATVNYGYLDLKFANNYRGPIIIKSGITNGKLWVQIMGRGK